MDQQVTHGDVGVAQIGAEQGLAKVVEELTACGVAAEELATLMPRAVKGGVALPDVGLQAAEKRRQQLGLIFLCRTFQLFSIKILIAVAAGKDAGQARQILGRQRLVARLGDKDRQAKGALLDLIQHAAQRILYRQHHGGNVGKIAVSGSDKVTLGINTLHHAVADRYF